MPVTTGQMSFAWMIIVVVVLVVIVVVVAVLQVVDRLEVTTPFIVRGVAKQLRSVAHAIRKFEVAGNIQSFQQWAIASLRKGAGMARKFAMSTLQEFQQDEEECCEDVVVADNRELVEFNSQPWRKLWNEAPDYPLVMPVWLSDLKCQAAVDAETYEPISADIVRAHLRSSSRAAGVGAESMTGTPCQMMELRTSLPFWLSVRSLWPTQDKCSLTTLRSLISRLKKRGLSR
jgi:hypothetical protein